ncbi:unnamed protein product [Enterobius vermicularis]|uniref:Enhancer of mRNA-decapping protein 4 n=1 Tax=Enterobius vermicularis TaxID=51028 RepID=A0A0N4UXV1_ENTVE|nr:unnamed protein product [Enterobius vermicularis]
MAATSKLSFRARNLDASKPMPVYVADELPDLSECTPINRAVAQMPTGMEKDEEMLGHIIMEALGPHSPDHSSSNTVQLFITELLVSIKQHISSECETLSSNCWGSVS